MNRPRKIEPQMSSDRTIIYSLANLRYYHPAQAGFRKNITYIGFSAETFNLRSEGLPISGKLQAGTLGTKLFNHNQPGQVKGKNETEE
jgi:hypothetical protein